MTIEEAWAAGLFDGEGSVSVCSGQRRLQLKMVDEATVRRFHAALGKRGKVYGPYVNRAGEKDGYQRSPFFMWVAVREDAEEVARLLAPILSDVRLAGFEKNGFPHEMTPG